MPSSEYQYALEGIKLSETGEPKTHKSPLKKSKRRRVSDSERPTLLLASNTAKAMVYRLELDHIS